MSDLAETRYLVLCVYTVLHQTYIDREQVVVDVEKLTSDLLTRLQRREEDLNTANECKNCAI